MSTLRINISFSLENIFILVHLEYMALLGIGVMGNGFKKIGSLI